MSFGGPYRLPRSLFCMNRIACLCFEYHHSVISLSLYRNSFFLESHCSHRDATFYDHRSLCQKKHPQRRHTINEKVYHDVCTRHVQSSGTGLPPVCTKHQKPNSKMCLCTYTISSVHSVDVRFYAVLTYYRSLHPFTSICVCVFVVSTSA